MYRCLHGQAPRYLADHLTQASDVASRRRLRSVKPKFHYTDFPVTSATSPRQTRDVPFSPIPLPPGKFRGSRHN